MKPNRLKKLSAGQTIAVGAQLRFGSPAIAELFGLAGFDWILIDGEHAPQSPMGIQAQLHAIGCTDATPIVRVRTNDPELFRVYLDMGAGGIVVFSSLTPHATGANVTDDVRKTYIVQFAPAGAAVHLAGASERSPGQPANDPNRQFPVLIDGAPA